MFCCGKETSGKFKISNLKVSSAHEILLKMENLDGTKRKNINIGDLVEIVQKKHQRTGELTEGIVKRILTNASNHPHGIKVMLQLGEVGRVKNIIPE